MTTISFRIDDDKEAALDALAAEMDRDRSFVLNQAIEALPELRSWQHAHIEEGLRQADAAEFASKEEVEQARARWRR